MSSIARNTWKASLLALRYFSVASAIFAVGLCWGQNTVRMEVFVRADSDISVQAAQYAKRLGERRRGLDVVIHDVIEDRQQLSRLWRIARHSGREKPVVPAFYCCDRLYFGFSSEAKTGPAVENLFTADVYTRSTCSKCKAAKAFIGQLSQRWPAIRFRIYEITYDTDARRRYQELCQSRGKIPGLPTIHFAGQVMIGYQGDHSTGAELEAMIRKAAGNHAGPAVTDPNHSTGSLKHRTIRRASIGLTAFWKPQPQDDSDAESKREFDQVPLPDEGFDDVPLPEVAIEDDFGEGALVEEAQQSEPESDLIQVPFFGELSVSELGLPAFTFLVGLVDGFNPCAMWILVFLLSVLVNIKDRKKILLIAGTFVVVSGMAYYAFMAAWLNLFMLIGIARPAQIILGVMAIVIGVINVKDFFAFKQGVSLSIPDSQKPGIYKRVREIVAAKYLPAALASVIVLAVIVNLVELLCTAGLPALYTQILTMQDLAAWQNYAYLGLYISAYMLDDTVLLAVIVATLSHRKLQEREGRWLKLGSGAVILALGVVMIFRPDWLQLTAGG